MVACAALFAVPEDLFSQETVVAMASPTTPIIQIDEEAEKAKEDYARTMEFFEAIANNDKASFCRMLNDGMDPNVELPADVPKAFSDRFKDERLNYYVSSEPGFTALMLAAGLQNKVFVKILLAAGAERWRLSRRHKTHALWLAAKSNDIEMMRALMNITPEHESNKYLITVDLSLQKAILYHNGNMELVTPISSGRDTHPTPRGKFLVTDKHRHWVSTLYDARMPYFMRLSCGDFGLHHGPIPGFPASHGCIRLPDFAARQMFAEVPIGTLVEIK